MAEHRRLSLQLHSATKIVRHSSTLLSLLLAVPALYIIFRCANRVTKRYSVLIAMIVILGSVNDVLLNMILDPLVLLPQLCVLRESPIIPIPGSPYFYYELWVRLITMNIPIFAACFIERHQAVQNPSSRFLVSKRARVFLIVLFATISFIVASTVSMGKMRPDQESLVLGELAKRWPTVSVERSRCYDRISFIKFAATSIGGFLLCGVFTTAITLHTFASLRKPSTLSEAGHHNNRSMTKALILQVLSPFSLILFPLFFSLIAVMLNVEGPCMRIYIPNKIELFLVPFSISYMLTSLHSPIHSILLLTLIRIYRNKIVEMFSKKFVAMKVSESAHRSSIPNYQPKNK